MELSEDIEGQSEELKGLLISMLTIFDLDRSRTLSKDEYVRAAAPLGFDVSDSAWIKLRRRFGDVKEGQEDGGIDLDLIGGFFANKYDTVLQEMLRHLLIGVVNTNSRNAQLEKRLRAAEEHLEATSMREMREKENRIAQTIRRWRHRYAPGSSKNAISRHERVLTCSCPCLPHASRHTSVAFDLWKQALLHSKEVLQHTVRHWASQALSHVMRRWMDMVHEQREQHVSVGHAVARMRLRFVAMSFEVCACAARRARERRLPRPAAHRPLCRPYLLAVLGCLGARRRRSARARDEESCRHVGQRQLCDGIQALGGTCRAWPQGRRASAPHPDQDSARRRLGENAPDGESPAAQLLESAFDERALLTVPGCDCWHRCLLRGSSAPTARLSAGHRYSERRPCDLRTRHWFAPSRRGVSRRSWPPKHRQTGSRGRGPSFGNGSIGARA